MTRLRFCFLVTLTSLVLSFGFGLASSSGVLAADTPANSSSSEKYPPDVAKSLHDGCMKSKDLPADRTDAVCSCYSTLVQFDVPYPVFAKTSSQIKAKGIEGLDAEGKEAMLKNGNIATYCRLKNGVAASAEERGTFPESELPALHESCMAFKDVAAADREKFCGCYEKTIRTKISYADWRILSLAIATKGLGHLDPEETTLFDFVRSARLGCGGAPK